MNANDYLADQRAQIEADQLMPQLITQAALAHKIMHLVGHTADDFHLGASGPTIATLRCGLCGAAASLTVVKTRGSDAVLLLDLPPGSCPTPHEPCRPLREPLWISPYTNDAPDGNSHESV